MSDYGRVYRQTRERVTDLVRNLSPEDLQTSVPASPDWSVKDVVAHVTGITCDALDGKLEGTGTDEWTEAQVGARRERSIEEVLEEWGTRAPQLEDAVDSFPPAVGLALIQDLYCHEQDIRGALHAPGARDSEAAQLSLEFNLERLRRRIDKHGLPTLRVRTASTEWTLGDGEPQATVEADDFELSRALAGRRTLDEIRAMRWDGDPAPWLDHLSMYGTPGEPLGESSAAGEASATGV
ncbi:MAG TPA: maleylpyruvate isomerase family mycothiol-dependent enzyme [Actinomycetota bacterium]|nr:maleylpyruvate isomerase family mycothiol-dependent enzyme [Actinomycetota bacterium]